MLGIAAGCGGSGNTSSAGGKSTTGTNHGTGGSGGTIATGGTAGSGGTTGTGGCQAPTDCPDPSSECVLRTCTNGVYGTVDAAAGTAVSTQVPGDCKQVVCDGNGGTQSTNEDTDIPDDGETCTQDGCSNGMPAHLPLAGD